MLYTILNDKLKAIIFSIFDEEKGKILLKNLFYFRSYVLRLIRYIRFGFNSKKNSCPSKKIGMRSDNVYFGYYDITPFNHNETILLAARTNLLKISPAYESLLEIGYFCLNENPSNFHVIGQTNTWCWQQGCRLQWYPSAGADVDLQNVIYNKLIDNRYGCCVQEVKTTRVKRIYKRPVYSLSPDGRYGLSLNFSRLGRLRPGYGYTLLHDETEHERAPERDGIWRLEMESGRENLLFSVADITRFEPKETMLEAEHYFNHICVNPAGSRFLFFHVWVLNGKRYTRLITCNLDGGKPYALINEGIVSHYTWKTSEEVLCYVSRAETGSGYYLYKDLTGEREAICPNLLKEDGHPSYSPDKKLLLTDTYPDRYGDRNLLLYDVEADRLKRLGSFYSPLKFYGEFRCDLHPRWSPSGKRIAFDSAHEGQRGIYIIELS